MERIVVDVITGEQTVVPFTPEEIAAIQAAAAALPPVVPASITRPQCAKQLLAMALITSDEAIAMVANATPPAMVMTLINALSAPDQVTAKIDFARYQYDRDYPLLNQLMTAAGKTSTDIDNFFIAAAVL